MNWTTNVQLLGKIHILLVIFYARASNVFRLNNYWFRAVVINRLACVINNDRFHKRHRMPHGLFNHFNRHTCVDNSFINNGHIIDVVGYMKNLYILAGRKIASADVGMRYIVLMHSYPGMAGQITVVVKILGI